MKYQCNKGERYMKTKNRCEHGVWLADNCYKCEEINSTEHTQIPWYQNINAEYPIYAGDRFSYETIAFMDIKNPRAEANLKFIIRAVNYHDKFQLLLDQVFSLLNEPDWRRTATREFTGAMDDLTKIAIDLSDDLAQAEEK